MGLATQDMDAILSCAKSHQCEPDSDARIPYEAAAEDILLN